MEFINHTNPKNYAIQIVYQPRNYLQIKGGSSSKAYQIALHFLL